MQSNATQFSLNLAMFRLIALFACLRFSAASDLVASRIKQVRLKMAEELRTQRNVESVLDSSVSLRGRESLEASSYFSGSGCGYSGSDSPLNYVFGIPLSKCISYDQGHTSERLAESTVTLSVPYPQITVLLCNYTDGACTVGGNDFSNTLPSTCDTISKAEGNELSYSYSNVIPNPANSILFK